MNILMIGECYKYGGASEIMSTLSSKLRERGHRVIELYGYDLGASRFQAREYPKDCYVVYRTGIARTIHRRFQKIIERFNLSNSKGRKAVEELIKDYHIDIIHFHAMQGCLLSVKDIGELTERYKVVWTIHDTWPFTGGCMYYDQCRQWMESCENCEQPDYLQCQSKNPEVNLKYKKSAFAGHNIQFITPSYWMERNLEQSYLANEDIRTIHNGINTEQFYPVSEEQKSKVREKYRLSNNRPIILFVATSISNKYKGWKYLEGAIRRLRGENCQFVAIGNIDKALANDLNVTALGYITDKAELNSIYSTADIFVIPSIQDNFPTVTLEAMAAGTPVVGFNIGGVAEQISDKTGWVVNNVSSEALAESIRKAVDSGMLQQRSTSARKECTNYYTESLMTDQYEEAYKKEFL